MRAAGNEKAARDCGPAALENTYYGTKFKHTRRALQAVIALVQHGLWILDYAIEDARQRIQRGLQ